MDGALLTPDFFVRAPAVVAPELLGATLVVSSPEGEVAVRLTEVEAYDGEGIDPGSHAFRGQRPRNAVMFGGPGGLYVYFTYGMHHCANLVCHPAGTAGAVLLRGGEVVLGAGLARVRRSVRSRAKPGEGGLAARDLARGPGNLAQALGLTTAVHSGLTTTHHDGLVRAYGPTVPVEVDRLRVGPRVGVSGPGGEGTAYPWRFWIHDEPTVSSYRPGVPRAPRGRAAEGRNAFPVVRHREAG